MRAKILRIAARAVKFRGNLAENIERIGRFVAEAAGADSDVVLFQSALLRDTTWTSVDSPRVEIEAGLKAVAEAARAQQCHVLIGSPTFARGRPL
jgi:predicted amidohydrolase